MNQPGKFPTPLLLLQRRFQMEGASPSGGEGTEMAKGVGCAWPSRVLREVAVWKGPWAPRHLVQNCLFWQRLRRGWMGRAGSSQGLSSLQESWHLSVWRAGGGRALSPPTLHPRPPARPQRQAPKLNKERSPQPAPGKLFSKQQNPCFREKSEWFSEKPTDHVRQVKWI